MAPNNWSTVKLESCLRGIIDNRGKSVPKADKGIPLLTSRNVRLGRIDLSDKEYIQGDAWDTWMVRGKPKAGDVLFTTEAPVGMAAMYPDNGQYAIGQRVVCLQPNDRIDGHFLMYLLLGPHFRRTIGSQSIGSTAKGVKTTDLKEFEIVLPSVPEQKKIAEILSTWDRAIEAIDNLVKCRTVEVNHFIKGVLASNASRFKSIPLENVGEIVSGGTPDTTKLEFWDGGVQWVTPTDITALKSKYLSSTSRTISEAGLKDSSAKLLPVNSIVVCTRATVGELAIATVPMTTNQGFKSIVPSSSFDSLYLYYAVRGTKSEMLRMAAGSTFLEISKKDFCKLKISAPDLQTQRTIGLTCDAMDKEIEILEHLNQTVKKQKQGLMQKLLTGKVRVKV